MPLTERQALIVKILTTRHTSPFVVARSLLEVIFSAPGNERIGLVETILHAWPIPYDPSNGINTATIEFSTEEIEAAADFLGLAVGGKKIRFLEPLENGESIREVAQSILHDLKALSGSGIVTQALYIINMCRPEFVPYLGKDDLPTVTAPPQKSLRTAFKQNPRLYALYHAYLGQMRGTQIEVATAIEHILEKECENRDQRIALIAGIVGLIKVVSEDEPAEQAISEAEQHVNDPIDKKKAN